MIPSESATDPTEDLLASFFKAQVPDPWPACRVPGRPAPSERTGARRSEGRSRLVLAALCTALLGLGLVLSRGPSSQAPAVAAPEGPPGLLKSAVAEGKGLKGKGALPNAPEKLPR